MVRLRRTTAVATSLGLLAASVLTATTASTAQAAGEAGGPAAVNVFVAKNNVVKMPARLRPGLHKFVIRSGKGAGFQIVQADPGYTKAEAARDVFRGLTQGKVPALKRFERNITLVAGTPSAPEQPGVMWTRLSRGTYWALDTMPARPRAAKIRTLRVAGDAFRRTVSASAVIRAVGENRWARKPATMPHRGRLLFRNPSSDNHFVILTKLAKGKTIKDFRDWLEAGGQSPPPVNFNVTMDTGVVSPGGSMIQKYSLPRGKYVLICFWPDADMGGMPHAFMGMFRGITLT